MGMSHKRYSERRSQVLTTSYIQRLQKIYFTNEVPLVDGVHMKPAIALPGTFALELTGGIDGT